MQKREDVNHQTKGWNLNPLLSPCLERSLGVNFPDFPDAGTATWSPGGELVLSPECLWGHAGNWPDNTDASIFAITTPLGLGGDLNCGCEVVKFQG